MGPGRESGHARIPGEPGIWIVVFGDLMIFGLFFAVYAWYYRASPAAFAEQQRLLDRDIGLANTILLLTSSLFVALGVRAPERDDFRRYVALGMLCGIAFVVLKALEWRAKFAEGITIASGEFFIYYFALSGIHLAHVVLGLGVLAFIRTRHRRIEGDLRLIEGGGVFWHLVDILWVLLFPLLYLVRP